MWIKRARHGYPSQEAAANAGERALRRFLESQALKQEHGIMADKHSKPPEPPNDNAKSIDRWDDEGGAPSGGRLLRIQGQPPVRPPYRHPCATRRSRRRNGA